MNTSPPPPPAYGALIDLARKGTGLTLRVAAQRAGVAKATWIDNVRGYRKRDEQWEPVQPKPGTIARMAAAVSISPDRLASEGERPDAAEILREILRAEPAPSPGAPSPPASGNVVAADRLAAKDAAEVLFPDDPDKQTIWRMNKPESLRLALLDLLDRLERDGGNPDVRTGTRLPEVTN